MRKIIFLLIAAVLVLSAILYLRSHRMQGPIRNVLLITIDTLRADHLGCYGYGQANTSNIDRWAGKSTVFLNASATVPLTLPSHSSIMTGTNPYTHGVRDNGGFYLEESWTTLAETLRNAGFSTGGFISAFVLDRRWGIAQGFDVYFDNFELSKFKMISLDSVQRKGEETLNQALSWLDQKKGERFFGWIHLYDPHTPYDPPEPFRSEFKGRGAYELYDGEISYVDNLIGRVHDYLEKNELLSNTLVILMSDHGESLGEHSESGHGFFIYDATMRIPFILWYPGEKPRKVQEQVRSIDVFSTICEATGVKPPSTVEGTSLVPFVRGGALSSHLSAYSESYFPRYHYGWNELKSVRTVEYKYIDAPQPELYRLEKDPRERENIYAREQKRAGPFETQLARMLADVKTAAKGPQAVDNDSLEKLQALGYVGSYVSTANLTESGSLPDPKEKISLYNRLKVAQGISAEGKNKEAFGLIEEVLREDSHILEAHLVRGNILMKEKEYARARESFQNALALNPDYVAAIFGLAKAYKDEGQWEAAKAGFERIHQIDPRDTKPHFQLGEIAIEEKNFELASSHFQKAIALDPDQAGTHSRLGAVLIELKDYQKALKELERGLALNQRTPNAHFNTALVYEALGEFDKAIEEYRKELALYPEAHPAHFNLSRVYKSQGRRKEEQQELEACIRSQPDFGIAYLYLAKSLMDTGGDLQKAKDLVEEGMKKPLEERQAPFGHYLLADIYNRLGRPREAMAQVQQARSLERR